MTKVVLSCPRNCFTPAILSGFSYDLIKYFEREVILGLERSKGLKTMSVQSAQMAYSWFTVFMAVSLATFGSVNTPTYNFELV